MKMKKLTAVALVALLGSISANATVIFNDVFDGGGNPSAINDLSVNITNRQALGTTMSTYSNGGTTNGYMEINEDIRVLMRMIDPVPSDNNTMDLDTDFGASLADKTWSISYAANFNDHGAGPGSFQGWTGLHIGTTRGFGGEFTLLLREGGTYHVYNGTTQIAWGSGLGGLGEDYRLEATFKEEINSVSILYITNGGATTNHLGSHPMAFSGGNRFVQFRSHCDVGTAGTLWDFIMDDLTIQTLPFPSLAYLFIDSFDTADTTNVNANIESRQAAGELTSVYNPNLVFSITNNTLAANGILSLRPASNFAGPIVGSDFVYSFKLTVSPSADGWLGLYLLDSGQAGWTSASFGLRCQGVGDWAFWIHELNGTGAYETTGIGVNTISNILGYPYDQTQEHMIQLVSTASVDGTNSYDLVVDGVVIKSDLLYTHTEDTSRKIVIHDIGGTGDFFIDDLSLKLIKGITYEDWVVEDTGLEVGVNDDRTDDPDTDSMENLLEYALGGDPLVDDAASILPTFSGIVESSGTNYLNYVYRRRVDAPLRGLSYGVNFKFDIVSDPWTDAGSSFETGTDPINAAFESVLNLVPTVFSDVGFVTLKVTEN